LGANKGRPDHPMLPSPAASRVFSIFQCMQSATNIDLLSCRHVTYLAIPLSLLVVRNTCIATTLNRLLS